jgi:hypothetical protein
MTLSEDERIENLLSPPFPEGQGEGAYKRIRKELQYILYSFGTDGGDSVFALPIESDLVSCALPNWKLEADTPCETETMARSDSWAGKWIILPQYSNLIECIIRKIHAIAVDYSGSTSPFPTTTLLSRPESGSRRRSSTRTLTNLEVSP